MEPTVETGIDPKAVDAYLKSVLEDTKNPLSDTEMVLASKFKTGKANLGRLEQDIQQLQNQISQAQNRLKSLELQHQSETGRLSGILEALASLKFEVEVKPD